MATSKDDKTATSNYYDSKEPVIDDQAKVILTKYSGIPEDALVSHVHAVREKAWKLFQYPCIGMYSFMNFSISKSPQYDEVLERVKKGATLLDLACCFGQDIRKLIYDGAPPENVTGSELEQGFIDGGYDLFKDRDSLKSTITAGDFFSGDVGGLKGQTFDIIYAASFYHLFSWEEQVEAVSRTLHLLKPKRGSMLFGRQTGVQEAGPLKHPATRSGEMYRHNKDSFRRVINEVAQRDGLKLDCDVAIGENKRWEATGGGWKLLMFCIILQ